MNDEGSGITCCDPKCEIGFRIWHGTYFECGRPHLEQVVRILSIHTVNCYDAFWDTVAAIAYSKANSDFFVH